MCFSSKRGIPPRVNNRFRKFRITGLYGKQPLDAIHHLSCQPATCCFAPPIQGDIPVPNRSSYFRLCRGAAICMYMIDSQNGGNFRRYGFPPPPSRAIHAPSCCRWLLCCVLKSIDAHCMCQRKLHSVKLLTHMDQCSRLALNFPDRSLDNCMWRRSGSATPFEDHMNWPKTTNVTTRTTVKHSQMVTSRSTEDSWHASDTCHTIHQISFLRQCKHASRWQTR